MASTRANLVLVGLLVCLSLMAAETVQGYNYSSIDETIPAALQVPDGNEVQQIVFATGFQIYLYNGTTWILNNVSADLYNNLGLKIGFHFFLGQKDIYGGQPSWETFNPTARVTGKALASVPVQSDSINWVLLNATSHDGHRTSFLDKTTFIQRIYTQHGKAPTSTVNATAGDLFNSSYAALYKFSAASPGSLHCLGSVTTL